MGLQPAVVWQLSQGTVSGPCGFTSWAVARVEREPSKTTQERVSKMIKEMRVNALGAPLKKSRLRPWRSRGGLLHPTHSSLGHNPYMRSGNTCTGKACTIVQTDRTPHEKKHGLKR